MAMTIKTDGIEELGAMLAKLDGKAYDVASAGLYQGAGKVGDAFTAATNRIITEPYHYLARPDITGTKRYASPEEKAALLGKSGIARFNRNGDGVDTIIGISGAAGYANVNGKRTAVRVIARSINSGTSFMQKQPVYRKAVSASKGAAQEAIVKEIEKLFNEIIGGK